MVQLNLLPVLELFVGFAYNSASFVIDKRRLFFSLWTEYSIEEIRLKLIRGFVLQISSTNVVVHPWFTFVTGMIFKLL